MCGDRRMLEALSKRFSVSVGDVPARVEALVEQVKALDKQIKDQETAAAVRLADGLVAKATDVKGVTLIAAAADGLSGDALKSLADAVLAKVGSAVVVIGGASEGKAQFVVEVSADLLKRGLHAGKIVKEVAKVAGGGGGGQPALARAGGKDASKVPEAVAKAAEIVGSMVLGS